MRTWAFVSLTLAFLLLTGCTAVAGGAPLPDNTATVPPGPTAASASGAEQAPAGSPPAPASATNLPPGTPAPALEQAPPLAPGAPEGAAATGETSDGAPFAPPDGEQGGAGAPTPEPTAPATAVVSQLAAPRPPTVVLDPGHGGPEIGAAAPGLAEKDLNLQIARQLADLLRADGYQVVLTREEDRTVSPTYTGGGYPGGLVRDLQARVDIANAARADIFVSIHNNGSPDSSQSGTEVWYSEQRTFSDRNQTLAELVLANLVQQIRGLGYPVVNRGIKPDTEFRIFRGRAFNLFVLGPGSGPREHVPTQMPAVLGESLFLSNPSDAAMLRQPRTLAALAAGYHEAIVAYFARYPQ